MPDLPKCMILATINMTSPQNACTGIGHSAAELPYTKVLIPTTPDPHSPIHSYYHTHIPHTLILPYPHSPYYHTHIPALGFSDVMEVPHSQLGEGGGQRRSHKELSLYQVATKRGTGGGRGDYISETAVEAILSLTLCFPS